MSHKNIRNLLAVILLSGTGAIQPAYADNKAIRTVHDLAEACSNKQGAAYGFCVGYVSGIMDLMGLSAASATGDFRQTVGMCAPDDTTYAAAVQAFINWAGKHPERWQVDKEAGVVLALHELWPCRADDAPK